MRRAGVPSTREDAGVWIRPARRAGALQLLQPLRHRGTEGRDRRARQRLRRLPEALSRVHVFYHHRRRAELRRPSTLLLCLVALQITLGALTVLSGRQPIINSLHVVTGASVLVTSLVVTLRAHRARFDEGALGVRVPRHPRPGRDPLSTTAKAGAHA